METTGKTQMVMDVMTESYILYGVHVTLLVASRTILGLQPPQFARQSGRCFQGEADSEYLKTLS
jgi:hypothetical protein